MNKIKIIISLLFIFTPFFCLAGTGALSDDMRTELSNQWGSQGLNSEGIFEYNNVEVTVAKIIQAFLSLLGMIFIVLMLLGGYNWMTAQGDESKVEKAKSTIQRAVIGLIITVSAYSITYTIFKFL